MSIAKGALYVVATPIGNLSDLSTRAVQVLGGVDLIAAEDTRHSARLLRHFGIATPTMALHEHNEREASERVLTRLRAGEAVALVSDAGTPLLSDPGFYLVREAVAAGLRVIPVPGPSALLAALSAAGLPTDRFAFEGFLPSKPQARRERLRVLSREPRTLAFFEAPHRIEATLADLIEAFGAERPAVLARELTKLHETVLRGSLAQVAAQVAADPQQRKGEMVLLVQGAPAPASEAPDAEAERILRILLEALPASQAAAAAARITGARKKLLYDLALKLAGK